MRRADLSHLPVLFTAQEGLAAGVTRHQRQGASRRAELRTLARGVYAVPGPWSELSPQQRHQRTSRAAALRDGNAVLSHVSAALVWGLPNPRGELPAVWLTVTGAPRVNRPGNWVHLHRAAIPHRHRRVVDGIPVTSPARTVVDCLRSLRSGDALAVADAALRRGLTSLLEIEDVMDVQYRWPFVGRAHTLLPLLDPRRENWLESYSAARLAESGVPPATPQVEVFDADGRFVARVDALWEEAAVVGEADGAGKYLGDFDASGDRSPGAVARRVIAAGARESRLRELGLAIVRWDPDEIVRRPLEVARRVRLAQSRQELGRVRAFIRRPGEPAPTLYAPDRV